MVNRFVILWGLTSPICMGLVASGLNFSGTSWYPAFNDMRISIIVYLVYWVLLAVLQAGALFWKFQDKQLAYKWFLTTSITGFLVMFLHDIIVLKVMGVDARGQGVLILLLSLPPLAMLGGLILGFAQFGLIQNRCQINKKSKNRAFPWLFISTISWIIGFSGILLGNYMIVFVAIGSALKGWFINKYLQ